MAPFARIPVAEDRCLHTRLRSGALHQRPSHRCPVIRPFFSLGIEGAAGAGLRISLQRVHHLAACVELSRRLRPSRSYWRGLQTTAWLYCFWPGGFAVLVLVYAVLATRDGRTRRAGNILAGIAAGVGLTAAVVLALTVLATVGHDLLTPVMSGADYSMLVSKDISPAICIVSIAALILLWRRRNTSALGRGPAHQAGN
jgi:ABC-type Fe3+-siderophore transport system permease subunit